LFQNVCIVIDVPSARVRHEQHTGIGTGATYVVQEADEGAKIRVLETATDTDSGGQSMTSTSAATAAVSDITLAFTSIASISGGAQEGQTLTAVNGTLNDVDASVTGYQWQSSTDNFATHTDIGTGATYVVQEADEDTKIRVVETATNTDSGGQSTTSTSAATAAVSDITPGLTAATIASAAKEGDVLSITGGTPAHA
jgi:hypothetical protein